jgi:hypothetical protein
MLHPDERNSSNNPLSDLISDDIYDLLESKGLLTKNPFVTILFVKNLKIFVTKN